MDVKEYLEQQVKQLVEKARAITRAAESESRTLNDEERMKVEGLISESNELRGRISEIEQNEQLVAAIDRASSVTMGDPTTSNAPAKSLGEAFVKSAGYQAVKARGTQGQWTTGPVEFDGAKLTDDGLSVGSITGAGGALPLQPQVAPMIGPVEQELTVAALFGQGTATQNSIVYLEETTTETLLGANPYSGNSSLAATTAEGVAKSPVFVDFTKRTTSIEKIAAFLPVSDEMIEDEPAIMTYINGRLVVFVRQAEEAYCMNKLLGAGIVTISGSEVGGGSGNMFDAIAAGINSVQVNGGLVPDGVVIHPVDFWKMAVSKDAVAGQYFSGGPYAAPARSPWGITTVVTREAILGKPLVGAFKSGATLWRKGGLSVEASNSHADYFRKNLTALRAEERLGLTVFRPTAFRLVTPA